MWQERVAERGRGKIGAMALDLSFEILAVSSGVEDEYGLAGDTLIGRSAVEMVHPDDLERAAAVLSELSRQPGDRPEGLYRLALANGEYRYYTISSTNLGPEHNNVMLFDFTEPSPEIRAQAFAEDAVDAMRILTEDLPLEESFEWISRVAERHVQGLQLVVTLVSDHAENLVFSRHEVPAPILKANLNATPNDLPPHVVTAQGDHSDRRWLSSRMLAVLDDDLPARLTSIVTSRSGEMVGYIELLRESPEEPDDNEWPVIGMISRMVTAVMHRHEFDCELRRAAELDPLTGLLNRRKLLDELQSSDHLAGSLLYLIDLDRFSWVNNNLGHQAGDETLISVAEALRAACPDDALIARLGGDEFVVWIPAEQAGHDLESLGSQLSQAMAVPAGSGDQRVLVRASLGMVRVQAGETTADALNRADVAMYSAKRGGGDSAAVG